MAADMIKKWGNNPDTWMVLLTGLLLFVGTGTALVFYRQFDEMSKQTSILNSQLQQSARDSAEDSRRAEDQLTISRELAKAARDNVTAIQQQMRGDQRAWVGSGDTTFTIKTSSPIDVRTVGKNVGKTPAVDASPEIYWVIKPKRMGALALKDIVYGRWARRVNHGTVFPGQTFGIEFKESEVAPNQTSLVSDLTTGSSIFYIYGLITYRDVFDNPHWTHFCYAVNKDLRRAGTCAIYNDSDSDKNQGKPRRRNGAKRN